MAGEAPQQEQSSQEILDKLTNKKQEEKKNSSYSSPINIGKHWVFKLVKDMLYISLFPQISIVDFLRWLFKNKDKNENAKQSLNIIRKETGTEINSEEDLISQIQLKEVDPFQDSEFISLKERNPQLFNALNRAVSDFKNDNKQQRILDMTKACNQEAEQRNSNLTQTLPLITV